MTSDTREPIALHADRIQKQYRAQVTPALNNCTFHIREGEFYGLLGANGAGKTTAVSIFSGLVAPDTGTASVFGCDVVKKTKKVKQLIGLVPQNIALYENLTAKENLQYFGKLHGLRKEGLRKQVEHCLDFAALSDRAKDRVAVFSGGMKRRLNLAAGLLHKPRLLILDEPTVGVDTQSRYMIHQGLRELNARGTTILLTGHYLEEMEKLCTRIGIIDQGAMIAEGTLNELLTRYGQHNLEGLFLHLTRKQVQDT